MLLVLGCSAAFAQSPGSARSAGTPPGSVDSPTSIGTGGNETRETVRLLDVHMAPPPSVNDKVLSDPLDGTTVPHGKPFQQGGYTLITISGKNYSTDLLSLPTTLFAAHGVVPGNMAGGWVVHSRYCPVLAKAEKVQPLVSITSETLRNSCRKCLRIRATLMEDNTWSEFSLEPHAIDPAWRAECEGTAPAMPVATPVDPLQQRIQSIQREAISVGAAFPPSPGSLSELNVSEYEKEVHDRIRAKKISQRSASGL